MVRSCVERAEIVCLDCTRLHVESTGEEDLSKLLLVLLVDLIPRNTSVSSFLVCLTLLTTKMYYLHGTPNNATLFTALYS